MKAIIVGPDRGLTDAFADYDVETTVVDGLATQDALAEAGVADADFLLLTNVEEATGVPIAVEGNPDIRVVVYSPSTMPEFVRGMVDFAVDPDLLDPHVVAEELTGNGE